jgi:hypothetical protein
MRVEKCMPILVGRPDRKRLLERPCCRQQDAVNMFAPVSIYDHLLVF